jgi:hypothetical protein
MTDSSVSDTLRQVGAASVQTMSKAERADYLKANG